jgi:hypothetical protein
VQEGRKEKEGRSMLLLQCSNLRESNSLGGGGGGGGGSGTNEEQTPILFFFFFFFSLSRPSCNLKYASC